MQRNNLENWVLSELNRKLGDSASKKECENTVLLSKFWNEFYSYAEVKVGSLEERTSHKKYTNSVIQLLNDFREKNSTIDGKVVATKNQLFELQKQIEDMTMRFDEESIFKSSKNILSILIDENKESAKDYLLNKLSKAYEDVQALLSELGLGQFTIEALIVHVLCVVFHSADSNIMIRVATLVEQLEGNVRSHIKILRERRLERKKAVLEKKDTDKLISSVLEPSQDSVRIGKSKDSVRKKKSPKMYPIGTALVEFMVERGLVTIECNSSSQVVKKGISHFIPNTSYVICNFDISLLPIKLNLPMVHPPMDWSSAKENAVTLSDLQGGYLGQPTSEMYGRYSLLTSTNIHNFYLELCNPEKICNIMNTLQNQQFQINSEFLQYLIDNETLSNMDCLRLGLLPI